VKERKKVINFIIEVSVLSALGLVLDLASGLLSGWLWPNGGSISLAMICIFIASYRHGLKGGLLTGFLVGTIQIIWAGGSYLIHPVQVLLDYPLPYMCVGLSGIFSKQVMTPNLKQLIFISLSIFIGCFFRLVCHVLSGMIYWGVDFIGSLVYNGTFMLIGMIVCIIITSLLMRNKFFLKTVNEE